MYIFCHFDEVSAIRWPKIMTFQLPVPKYSLRILLFLPETNEKLHTGLLFTTLISLYPLRNSYPMEAIHAQQSDVSGFFNRSFLFSKTQQEVETYSRYELIEQISEIRAFQSGDTREHNNFLPER